MFRTVAQLKSFLLPQTTLKNNLSNSNIWLRIGLLLQSAEIGYHAGGGRLKLQARDAFDNSITLNNGSLLQLDVQAFYFRGILLKTLGQGYLKHSVTSDLSLKARRYT